jgi:uncharacterized SAM-binding protein YcdF (DUF218 family)
MKKKLIKYTLLTLGIMLAVVAAQTIYFFKISSYDSTLEKADLIVVFSGESKRVDVGLQLAKVGYAGCVTVAGAGERNLKPFIKKNKVTGDIRLIISDSCRTTFEDAVSTRDVVKKSNFKSIILVTSSYHLPRAYFLLRMLLLGENVKMQIYGVRPTDVKGADGRTGALMPRLIYNEMLQFWGSIGEMLSYKVTGELPVQDSARLKAMKFLKKRVLFDVQ